MTEQEQALVQQAQSGDAAAFSVLYELYITKIYSFIYYRTHHKQNAEDITSAVFMKALQKINSYNSKKGAFSAWLYTIARNAVTDHYRTQRGMVDIEDVWGALKSEDNIPRDLDAKAKLEEVDVYLSDLNSATRNIIIMRLWDGLGYKEISVLTGKSEAACKMTFSRGIKKLREHMPLATFIAFITTSL